MGTARNPHASFGRRIAGRRRRAIMRAAGLWHEAQDIRPDADRLVSKKMRSPSRAMADSGATGGRTSRTGYGFSPLRQRLRRASAIGRRTVPPPAGTRPAVPAAARGSQPDQRGGAFTTVAGVRIEIQRCVARGALEVEHAGSDPAVGIERPAAKALALQPVVLDEAHHRSQRDLRVIDVVRLAPRARSPGTAARVPGPQRPFTGLPSTPRGAVPVPHLPGAVELIRLGIERRMVGLAIGVIVPAVGIVPGDKDRGVLPVRLLLR